LKRQYSAFAVLVPLQFRLIILGHTKQI